MMKRNFLTVLICIVMLCTTMFSAVSCNKKQDPDATGNSDTNASTQNGDVISDEEFYRPEEKTYDRTLTFMCVSPSFYGVGEGYELGAGSVVDDAMFKRDKMMYDKFGVEVIIKSGTEAEFSQDATGGAYVCDFFLGSAQANFRLLQQNLFVDFAGLKNLNLEAPYWDQNIQTEYAVADRIYLLEGDYTYYDEYRTYVMLYNDQLYTNLGYYETHGTPYSMVENRTWTFDKMLDMSKEMYKDLNDNGKRDEFDQYGIIGAMNMQWCCYLGAGLKTVETVNGELVLNIKSDGYYNQVYDVLDDVLTKMTKNADICYPNFLQDLSTDQWTAASNIFENNRALFRGTTLSAASRLGNMASRFGLLPMPAYTEGTDGYYGWLPGDTHTPLSMAKVVTDKEETAEILDTYCYYSRYGADSLYEEYFESFRISKFCETPDDLAMMNLVISNKTYDLDFAASITDFADVVWRLSMDQDISTLSSTLSEKRNSASTAMDEFILKIMELD